MSSIARFSDTFKLQRSKITIRPDLFQGRTHAFAKETVDKIIGEGFDKSQYPIIVWFDHDTGKYILISGHSRWEASQRLYKMGDKTLENMPVKEFKGELEDAIEYALLESNRSGTEEGLRSDLKAYKLAIQKAYNKEKLLGIFKPESKLKLLQDLSFLNENGLFLQNMGEESEKSFPYLQRNAQWVGKLRKQLPQLTDFHEKELFDYLYKNTQTLKISKEKFFELVENKVSRFDFKPEHALNLSNVANSSSYTDPIREQIKALEKEIEDFKKEISNKQTLIVKAYESNPHLVPKFNDRITALNTLIIMKIEQKMKLESSIKHIENNVVDLFSQEMPMVAEKNIIPIENQIENQMEERPFIKIMPIKNQMDKHRFIYTIKEELRLKNKHNKLSIEKIAATYGLHNKNIIKEYTELAIVILAREIISQNNDSSQTYQDLIELYYNQVNLSHRTSQSMLLQQYSTPVPIAYIASLFVNQNNEDALYFEPSAGNGLLTVALPYHQCYVNEVDDVRLENLNEQTFKSITKQDATIPFHDYYKKFEGIITNPPFGTIENAEEFDGFNFKTLDHLMALRALNCMKNNGKAAVIIGGHTNWDDKNRIQAGKNRIFFNYLYKHYHVEDVILIDGHKLYSRQGTAFNVRLILINGRKEKAEGFAPLKNQLLSEVIADFDDLWNRVFDNNATPNENNMKNDINLVAKPKYKVKDIVLFGVVEYEIVSIGDFREYHQTFSYKVRKTSGGGLITANESALTLIKAATSIEIRIRITKAKALAKIKILQLMKNTH